MKITHHEVAYGITKRKMLSFLKVFNEDMSGELATGNPALIALAKRDQKRLAKTLAAIYKDKYFTVSDIVECFPRANAYTLKHDAEGLNYTIDPSRLEVKRWFLVDRLDETLKAINDW